MPGVGRKIAKYYANFTTLIIYTLITDASSRQIQCTRTGAYITFLGYYMSSLWAASKLCKTKLGSKVYWRCSDVFVMHNETASYVINDALSFAHCTSHNDANRVWQIKVPLLILCIGNDDGDAAVSLWNWIFLFNSNAWAVRHWWLLTHLISSWNLFMQVLFSRDYTISYYPSSYNNFS